MKVLFLDIDGVLNYWGFIHEQRKTHEWWGASQIDPEKVQLLNEVLDKTGAVVVISSSWRSLFELDEIREMLQVNGFTGEIVGATPKTFQGCPLYDGDGELMVIEDPGGPWSTRAQEIKYWLEEHEVEEWAVVDDGNVETDHFVQTSMDTGMEQGHVDDLVFLLQPLDPSELGATLNL